MQNPVGEIIYIGKAVNLRRRVTSYTTPSALRDRKVKALSAEFGSLCYIETPSELEALLVESRLIKANLPPYNRRLTEPESCCYIAADFNDPAPRLDVTPRHMDDGREYLGPFPGRSAVCDAVEAVSNVFRLRLCRAPLLKSRSPCIRHELGKCGAPCGGSGLQSYRAAFDCAWESLGGRSGEAMQRLSERRDRLADAMRFEDALAVQNHIRVLSRIALLAPDAVSSGMDFALVTPSYLKGRPSLLLFSRGRLSARFLCGPSSYPDTCMIESGIGGMLFAGDLLPGRPSADDLLIINSYVKQHRLEKYIVRIEADTPAKDAATDIACSVNSFRLADSSNAGIRKLR